MCVFDRRRVTRVAVAYSPSSAASSACLALEHELIDCWRRSTCTEPWPGEFSSGSSVARTSTESCKLFLMLRVWMKTKECVFVYLSFHNTISPSIMHSMHICRIYSLWSSLLSKGDVI